MTNQPPPLSDTDTGVPIGRDAEFWYETGGERTQKRRDRYTGIVVGRSAGQHEIKSGDLGGRVTVPDADVIGEVK